jgi:serine/threonine-protein kinase
MSAGTIVTSLLVSILGTAATFVVMQTYVMPAKAPMPVDVPQVSGLTAEQGRALTEPLGLMLVIDGEKAAEGDRVAAGLLFDQKPLRGSRVVRGGEIHAYIATAPTLIAVPQLAGVPLLQAQQKLVGDGLRAGNVTEVVSPMVPPGAVILTVPAAGEKLKKGDAVELQVSKASEQVAVPSVRGKSLGGAKAALEALGLVLGDVRKGSDDNAADGAILRQTPAAATMVAKGQKVDVVVND